MVFSPLKLDLRPVTQHETQNGVEISLKLPIVLKKECRQSQKRWKVQESMRVICAAQPGLNGQLSCLLASKYFDL